VKLTDSIGKVPLVGPVYQKRLEKLGISTVADLLTHIPRRYEDFRKVASVGQLRPGEVVTIEGKVNMVRNQYTKSNKMIQLVEIEAAGGSVMAVWFNQPFLLKSFRKDEQVSLAGKVDWFGRRLALISPEWEKINTGQKAVHTGRLVPIYRETAGISSKWLRRRIDDVWRAEIEVEDYLSAEILEQYQLCNLEKALRYLHYPENLEEAERGRRRLAFDELANLQMQSRLRKQRWETKIARHKLEIEPETIGEFTRRLDFALTASQETAIGEIVTDLRRGAPMNRLLQGDVGSGKTVVAATAAFGTFCNGGQAVFMAPTQILASQHFNTLKRLFGPFQARVTLVTSAGVTSGLGKADIIVGTHALIHKRVDISQAGLLVIDEQHRFGVSQRALLVEIAESYNSVPHVLTMTATPIPRTVALTFYGDLEVSVLTEMPKGRKPVTTWVIPPEKRAAAYEWMVKEIKDKKVQAFVVCPLIEESEVETMAQVKAAKTEYERLQKAWPELRIEILHGKMKIELKNEIVEKFQKGEIDILVATPVVEVGLDIPNATMMVVEAAERFGLAQLHQLRGRVGRGKKKSYCLLMSETESEAVQQRLTALTKMKSGFELAEVDLAMRGPGEIFGVRQHGVAELTKANWQDIDLIQDSRRFSEDIMKERDKYRAIIDHFEQKKVVAN